MSLFHCAIRPTSRLGTRLLATSRPSAVPAQSISRLTPHKPQPQTRQLQTTARRQAGQEAADFVSIDELWELPADPQMADILPHPWRPRDLGTLERMWYKKYGPTFASHPDVSRDTLANKAKERANKAAKWAKKYGPDWYDIRSESFQLIRERRRHEEPDTSAEHRQWLELNPKLVARKQELRRQGAKDEDSPLHDEYVELLRQLQQQRREHAAKRDQVLTADKAMDEIFKRRGGAPRQNNK